MQAAVQTSKADAAAVYPDLGYNIVPVRPGLKQPYNPAHPQGKEWQEHPITTREQAIVHWIGHPDDNVAWMMGEQHVALDFDLKDGKQGRATLAWFAQRYPAIRSTLTQRSQSGGWHKVFRLKPGQQGRIGKHTNAKIGPNPDNSGLDIITGNAVILVAPSTTPTGSYRWKDASAEIVEMPDDLFDLLLTLEQSKQDATAQPDEGSSPVEVELPDPIIELIERGWFEGCSYTSPSEARAAVYRALNTAGYVVADIAAVVGKSPLRLHGDATRKDIEGEALIEDIQHVLALPHTTSPQSNVLAESTSSVGAGVLPSLVSAQIARSKSITVPSVSNIMQALRSKFDYIPQYDKFFGRIVLVRKYDGLRIPLRETDYNKMQEDLERIGFNTPNEKLLRSCVERLATEKSFDSLQDWIAALPPWDGVARIDSFFSSYCGADSAPYVIAAAQYLWTAIAGRASVPGTKADGVIVLLGNQGIGKTSLVHELAPTIDGIPTAGKIALDTRDADTYRKMQGKIVCEIPEMRGFRTREQEAIKDFISATEDEWIPKYKELAQRVPRRAIFIATGNEREFLRDPTGNRRWLPVEVARIDLPRLREDLHQLWAEALYLFQKHGVLYDDAERLAHEEHEKHLEHSELYESLQEVVPGLEKRGPFKLDTLLRLMSDKGLMDIGERLRKEITAELRLMGYDNSAARYDGKLERRWKRKDD